MKRMRDYSFLGILSAFLLLAFFSATPVHAVASWNVQTVDTKAAGVGNGYCPIVVDSNNNPRIAYMNKYARLNSSLGGFKIQQITTGAATGIALDANDNPNILCGELRVGFKYASWIGLNWTIQEVDPTYTWSVYAALALDSHGNPHVAYSTHETLKYASRSGSNWTIEVVDNGTDIPIQLSLALDSNDKPYILYSNPDLKLATLENSGWNIKNVPSPIGDVGNMVLDSKGFPHLIYLVYSVSEIKYASWNGFNWKTETAVSGFPMVNVGFLALDSLDYPHISFVSGQKLMYACWTGAEWNIQTAYTDLPVKGPSYLAVDSNRIPHISFRAYIPGGSGRSMYMMYAVATEPVPLYSPLPLQLVVTAVVIGAVVFVVYLWKKKT